MEIYKIRTEKRQKCHENKMYNMQNVRNTKERGEERDEWDGKTREK